MNATSTQRTTSLRSVIERAAGMHTAPVAGTTALQCGACASEAHGRCKGDHTVGSQFYSCPCICRMEQAADFDARWGQPWWASVMEAE